MKATKLRKGNVLKINNVLYRVMSMDHVTPGKGRAHVQTKLRALLDGTQTEIRFRSTDDVEKAYLETKQMQFLYSDQDGYHFMDSETFAQLEIPSERIGAASDYLSEGVEVLLPMYDGRPISVDLAASVELRVTHAEPGVKGDRVSGATKPVTLETGLVIQAPLFVDVGDVLKVDTRTAEYQTRVT